jgi:hypothetical protein
MRAVRAAIVIPALFALASKVIVDPQMALFVSFGGFATLVVAGFGGTRMDKLKAHLGFAVVGSILLVIGTLVSGVSWLAAVATIPVAFTIFFAGVLGPVQATAATAVLFAYVRPVDSAAGASTIGSRLEGWWMVSVAGTLAVLLLSPRGPGDRLGAAASALAREMAGFVRTASDGKVPDPAAMNAARDRLRAAFTSAPYRPTGLATADQALATVVHLLEQGAEQCADAFDGHIDVTRSIGEERHLLATTASVLDDVAGLLAGAKDAPVRPAFLDELERARAAAMGQLRDLSARSEHAGPMAAAHAANAQAIAVFARAVADSALIAVRRADPATIAAARRTWYGTATPRPATDHSVPSRSFTAALLARVNPASRLPWVAGATGVVARHASLRSVWFANSLRGAVALAVAVAVADLSGVQHRFWVVLGTLSVLRTHASGTEATALRALGGAAIGFVLGAALLAGIGTGQTAVWVAFPLALLVAAYAPGTAPFAIGQAAFTVMSVVLFNIIQPTGWKVGLLRIEDVALGCAVSVAVGALFWPHGASALVGDDLADAFRTGARYLTQAVDWALGERQARPDAASAALAAGLRLEDALRGFLAEESAKRASKEDLWALVTATQRLRLTAHTLAGLQDLPAPSSRLPPGSSRPLEGSRSHVDAPACENLRTAAAELAGFYDRIADEVGRPGRKAPELLPAPKPTDPGVPRHAEPAPAEAPAGQEAHGSGAAAPGPSYRPSPQLVWVQEHLHQLACNAPLIAEPALHVAQARRRPWWR